MLSYRLADKWSLNALLDWDWGHYPLTSFSNRVVLNPGTSQEDMVSSTQWAGAPRMFYVGIGISRRLW
jgi:hypothetical protein